MKRKLLLDVREAANELGLTPSQIYEHIEAGHFPEETPETEGVYVRLGHRIFFKRVKLRKWAGAE